MTDDLHKIKVRIKKLLAMADSTSPYEAEIAAKRAASLMDEYQLSHAEVIETELKDGDGLMGAAIHDIEYSRWPLWMQSLSIAVAGAFECQVAFKPSGNGKKHIEVQGYKLDVEMVQWVYSFLYEELNRLANAYVADNAHNTLSHYATVRNSFLVGAVASITDRCNEIVINRQKKQAGTSLIVMKKDAISKKFGKAKYDEKRTRTKADMNAYSSGKKAGNKVNLNRPVEKSKNAGSITS